MANLNTSDNLTFSFNELTDTIVSLHSYKMPVSFSDANNFLAASYDSLYIQNKGEYGVYFNERANSYVTLILNADSFATKNYYNFQYKLEAVNLSGNSIENINFTKYTLYNEYQTTGEITFANDTRRTDQHLRMFRTQAARDINSRNQLQRVCNDYAFLKLETDNLAVNQEYLQLKLYPLMYQYEITSY